MLSTIMAQKSYLICIQINHASNKTYKFIHKQANSSQSNVMILVDDKARLKLMGCTGILKPFRQYKLIDI